MRVHVAFRGPVALLTICLTVLAPGLAFADSGEPQVASAAVNELWQKGSGQVLIGNFHGAVDTLGQAETLEPGNTELKTAINWIRETINLDDSRERLRIRSYEHFVAEAKKAAEQARQGKAVAPEKEASEDQAPGEAKDAPAVQGPDEGKTPDEAKKDGEGKKEGYRWSKALDYTQRAMLNTKDEEAFRSEPWVKEIVDGALVEIDGYKKANEWRDALVVYDMLMSLYPKNQDYKAGFDFCRNRAHLDFAYGPKNDWRADLRDVGPEALGEILSRVEDDYVKTADCKKLCTSGLQSLLVLAQADSLTKTFPTLGDQDLVMSFVTRLNGLIKRKIEPAAKFGAKDVVSVFRNVLEANKDSLRLPENVVVDEFVAGLLEPLDEFTSVIWPSEVEEFNKHTRGEFVGVGIQITQPEGSCVRVETPLEDSPAYAAGVKPGDWITEVDGKSTRDMTINQAVREITGEPGTQVTLTIRNPLTDESRKLTLTRQRITIRTVSGFHRDEAKPTGWDYFIDPDSRIGYVSVTAFMDKTVDDLEQALKQLHLQGCRGLILDLRFNPGGLLTSAVRMCELFMAENDPIVQTKGRSRSQNTEIRSRFGQQGDGPPLIILVNEFSASASEIVAGALAGLKEACVVGTRTFGKGSVQNLIPIEDNQAYLKLTTAYYYIPDVDVPAKWYLLHRETDSESWGVEPHVIVKAIPQEIAKIARLRRERDLLKGKDQTRIPKEVLDRQATSQPSQHLQEDENPDTDPQLATALNIMRVKLLSKQPWALAPRHERILSHADAGRKAHLATP